MAGVISLSKVLQVRENEKNNTLLSYNQSLKIFEQIATKLYEQLKAKELAEEQMEELKRAIMPIDTIVEQMNYIDSLYQKVAKLQLEVDQARSDMEQKRELLTDAYKEVKIFEKLIEKRQNEATQALLKEQMEAMDEISIQQFMSKTR